MYRSRLEATLPVVVAGAAAPTGPLGSAGFEDVNKFAQDSSWLHEALRLYALYGVAVFALLLAVAWWSSRRTANPTKMAYVIWTAIGTLAALAINQPIASAVDERRPFVALPHVLVLISHGADPGFPSDHAVLAGAVAAGVFLVSARIGWVAVVAALLIAFARVYVGVHYPQDVMAGLALGGAVVLVGALLSRRLLTWLVVRAQATALAPLLVRDR
jgi:membrane-associated phospholipid phosphatase